MISLLNVSKTIEQVDPATATRLLDQALDLRRDDAGRQDACALAGPVVSPIRAALSSQELYPDASADPELSMPRAAAAIGISPRYASDLMAAEQTSFRSYVQTATAGAMQARSGRPRPSRPGISATSHSRGASTTSPISAASSSRGSASRRANGASSRANNAFRPGSLPSWHTPQAVRRPLLPVKTSFRSAADKRRALAWL